MHSRTKLLLAMAGVAAALGGAPAAASAAVGATVVGDSNTPVAINPAAPPTISNMDPEAAVHVDQGTAASYVWGVTGPAQAEAAGDGYCWHISDTSYPVTYQGNGAYTLHVQLFSDDNCTKPAGAAQNFPFTISSAVTLSPNNGTYLLGSTVSLDSSIPARSIADYFYALNGTVNPDGSLAGNTQSAFRDSTTGKVSIVPTVPGTYTIVGHASGDGQHYTAWSAPVTFRVLQKFGLQSLTFPRNRYPHFQLKGTVPYGSGGRVTVSQAYGKHAKKHFRVLGKPKLSSHGTFKVSFNNRKLGWYRFRFSYKGGGNVAAGVYYVSAKLRRL